MAWYDEVHFYKLKLTSDRYEYWTTPLSFREAKEVIGKESFITVSHKYDIEGIETKPIELNTKVIETITDLTNRERKSLREEEESRKLRLSIIQEIRSIPLSKWNQWRFNDL